ncbi:MAG: DNA-processing protein DprA [Pseudomonadota bacterium]|nr:DNA-processing protein DprA [Pseudomonadota bacterium]
MTPDTAALVELISKWPRKVLTQAIDQGAGDAAEIDAWIKQARPKQSRFHRSQKQYITAPGDEVVGYFDQRFPEVLRQIPDPPLALQVRGNAALLGEDAVAIVGSRRCTRQGGELAVRFAEALGDAGLVVVSGLAIGIDGSAHRGVLNKGVLNKDARTVACLGSGLSRIYPRAHETLGRQIVEQGGALVSEYATDVEARPYQFPERNRLISGLCRGVVLIEASQKSGALITARFALEQGRDVFALPGPVTSHVSQGCHRLIREGAELVTSADQVLIALGIDCAPDLKQRDLLPSQGYLLQMIDGYAKTFDELADLTGWSGDHLLQTLTLMELDGIVRQGSDGYIAMS